MAVLLSKREVGGCWMYRGRGTCARGIEGGAKCVSLYAVAKVLTFGCNR